MSGRWTTFWGEQLVQFLVLVSGQQDISRKSYEYAHRTQEQE